jgi:predicted transcriptional regulator
MKTEPFATRLSPGLKKALNGICRRFGLRQSFVVETALREKIEDLLDAEDLRNAIAEGSVFHGWEAVKKESRRGRK